MWRPYMQPHARRCKCIRRERAGHSCRPFQHASHSSSRRSRHSSQHPRLPPAASKLLERNERERRLPLPLAEERSITPKRCPPSAMPPATPSAQRSDGTHRECVRSSRRQRTTVMGARLGSHRHRGAAQWACLQPTGQWLWNASQHGWRLDLQYGLQADCAWGGGGIGLGEIGVGRWSRGGDGRQWRGAW